MMGWQMNGFGREGEIDGKKDLFSSRGATNRYLFSLCFTPRFIQLINILHWKSKVFLPLSFLSFSGGHLKTCSKHKSPLLSLHPIHLKKCMMVDEGDRFVGKHGFHLLFRHFVMLLSHLSSFTVKLSTVKKSGNVVMLELVIGQWDTFLCCYIPFHSSSFPASFLPCSLPHDQELSHSHTMTQSWGSKGWMSEQASELHRKKNGMNGEV